MNWGTFKNVLTDALIDHLLPIQVFPSKCVACMIRFRGQQYSCARIIIFFFLSVANAYHYSLFFKPFKVHFCVITESQFVISFCGMERNILGIYAWLLSARN